VYAEHLYTNIEALAQRLKTKRYRAKLVRRCYLPKENGKERPLGIPALEDKLVQLACAKLLTAIYEQDFLDCSYGYRPGRGALEAVRALTFDLQYGVYGYGVEVDVQGFFDTIPHDLLMRAVRKHTDCRWVLVYIERWLKAPVQPGDGTLEPHDDRTKGERACA